MKSLVLTIPVEHQEASNRIAVALGHDRTSLPGRTFITGFSPDGKLPVTHYSTRTQADDSFIALLVDEIIPDEPWEDYGLSVEAIQEVLSVIKFNVVHETVLVDLGWSYADHFIKANEAWDLILIE